MNLLFLTATALTLSVDSFLCCFCLPDNGYKKLQIILLTTVFVFFVSVAAYLLGDIIAGFVPEKLSGIGAIALIIIGCCNFMTTYSPKKSKTTSGGASTYLIIGFALGIDNAFAILSISVTDYPFFLVPIIFTAAHAALSWLGLVSRTKAGYQNDLNKMRFIPPLILIVLGLIRL